MRERYSIRLSKERFTFCAAHFITFAGNVCEPLHGHNYGAAVEIEGELDENHYVVDFIAARDAFEALTRALDHRVLLPTQHPLIHVQKSANGDEVEARFQARRWVFPAQDCMLLPLPNTTAEQLAQYLGRQLLDALAGSHGFSPGRMRVEVDECQGQIGVWELYDKG